MQKRVAQYTVPHARQRSPRATQIEAPLLKL